MDGDFLTALRAQPNDNVTRLVYADWLQEQEDSRAEFLRLEVRLSSGNFASEERAALANRHAELGRHLEPGWLLATNRLPFVRCRLSKSPGSSSSFHAAAIRGSPLLGKLELANYATHAMVIAWDANLLQYLRVTITDPLGAVSESCYDEFPITAGTRHWPLSPGERFSLTVNLLKPIPADQVMVGAYTVAAAYDYDGVQSHADPVRVELTDEDRRRWRLGRYARE
jgi:uncharacterized protein (TIGR02996 family)